MKSKTMTVKAKLALAFGGLALLVLVVAGMSLKSLDDANRNYLSYVEGISARATTASHVRAAVDQRAIAARNLVLVTKPADMEAEKALVAKAHEQVQAELSKLQKMALDPAVSPRARELIAEIGRIEQKYGPVALAIVKLAVEKQTDAAIAKMNDECRPLLAALINVASEYASYTEAHAVELTIQSAERYSTQRTYLLFGCVVAFLAAGVAGVMITRSIGRALGAEPADLGIAAQKVASGDLDKVQGVDSAPQGSVLASLGAMQSSLSDIVSRVRHASESIATGSAQIAIGNADLSQRTEEQASALQQTAATMDELGTTVSNNAASAKQANQLAVGASSVAVKGGEVVNEVVVTMRRINDSSKKIVDIIGVIDGIAFQTNILALNAAVEAARAGEQGRGFAVVAGEVRTLAQRSAQAAREIKTLITTSVEQVEQGTALVDRAGQTMGEVVGAIRKVSDIVAEISAASAEQSSGVSQVGQAVSQMDHVTQQNSALVEESAAAAESLKLQAAQLVQTVAVFRIAA